MKVLDLTRALLHYNTINPPGEEQACARHVGRILEDAGFTVKEYEFAERRTSLVARLGGTGDARPLCFTGHLDVVPLGGRTWTRDAFAGEIDDGRLYGRGSSDMKSGVAAFVIALTQLARHLRTSRGVVLVLTAGEETFCDGARHLARLDGALGQVGALVVAEPTCNYPFVGHKGALWLLGRTSGVTAHGSMPERGVNAVYKAARAVLQLERFGFDVAPHPVLGAPTLNVGTLQGGLNVNSVPDSAEIGIDIRTIPGQRHGALLQRLTEYLGDVATLENVSDAEGVWTDPGDPWIQSVYDMVAPVIGERPVARAAPYFTDAATLVPAYGGIPAVILGPGELALAHQTDEYCEVERMAQAVDLFTEITRRWCKL